MESGLRDLRALYRALQAGTMEGEYPAQIEAAMGLIDDPLLVDLRGNQPARYEAAQ
jgi:hypothetical protein